MLNKAISTAHSLGWNRSPLITVLTLFLLVLASPSALASDQQEQRRKTFLNIESLAKQGKLAVNDPRLANMRDYPLYPYLEYHRLAALGSRLNRTDVERFRAQFPDLHLEALLRIRLMNNLSAQGEWTGFIHYYRMLNNPSTEQQCLYGRALERQGDLKSAYQIARTLWVAGQSQPKACDPLFQSFRRAGQLDSELALTRLFNALDSNRAALAGYARRFIKDKQLLAIADEAQQIYRTPEKVFQLNGSIATEYQARMQHIAVSRAYRSGPERALNLLLQLDQSYQQTPANLKLMGRVGVRIAKDLNKEDRPKLAQLDPQNLNAELTEWRIRLALMEQDWSGVLKLIERLPSEVAEESRWRYWRAIAAATDGSKPELEDLHRERSFYGFIAAELQRQPYSLNQQSPVFTEQLISPLRNSEPMKRIGELVALDRYSVARSEWNSWIEQLTAQQRQAAARLMSEIGWHQMGILAAAYEGFWNDMVLRFPQPHTEHFQRESKQRQIDPLWSLAVSRQESALFPWARSGAGARGLMQLMPGTAKQTAKREKIPYRGGHELYEAHTNIRIGTAYLAQMSEQFNGNRVFATAAYNAGPHRVERWLKGRESLPLDIWIELIPFDETRTYVQNVLSFRVIYAELTDQPRSLFSDMERRALVLASR